MKNGISEKQEEEEEKQPEVEELSDMMCSLVTNNCGETRYIGTERSGLRGVEVMLILVQALRLGSRSSRRKVCNGWLTRLVIPPSKL